MAEITTGTDSHFVTGETGPQQTLVRLPKQDRSRRTLERILNAGLHLLEQEGPDSLTVTGITQQARTSVGSFYARFKGKDDLLRYLGEQALIEATEVWTEFSPGLWAGGSLRAAVAGLVQRLGSLYLDGAGRSLVLLDGVEDPGPTRRRRLEDRIAEDMRGLADVPRERSDLATSVLTGVLRDAAVHSLRDRAAVGATTTYDEPGLLLTELVELLVAYLEGGSRAGTSTPIGATGPTAPMAPGERRPALGSVSVGASEAPATLEPGERGERPVSESAPETSKPSPSPDPDPFDVWS